MTTVAGGNQQGGAPDIEVLTQFLNSLESYSQDLVQHLRSGQKLCHYTSIEGAIGILTGNDLWLTNSRYSNDDEELEYGHRLVDLVLDELGPGPHRSLNVRSARMLLAEGGHSDARVQASTTPYRG